jgi:hypothetical protein
MVLGWKFSVHIFDLHTSYLAASNIIRSQVDEDVPYRLKKDLAAACRAYGIDGWEGIDKGAIAEDIGNGQWEKYGVERVFQYCEDVRMSTKLLHAQLIGTSLLKSSAFCIGRIIAQSPPHSFKELERRLTYRCGTLCRRTRLRWCDLSLLSTTQVTAVRRQSTRRKVSGVTNASNGIWSVRASSNGPGSRAADSYHGLGRARLVT